MVSSSGDPTERERGFSPDPGFPAKPQANWAAQLDTEQMFRLIDSILPFEACLYHQVLPLALEGSRLKLGMVNLDDTAAGDYVRRILAYMNCSLVPQSLSSEVHHAALSAYLNYNQKKSIAPPQVKDLRSHFIARRIERKLSQEATRNAEEEGDTLPSADSPNAKLTLLVESPDQIADQHDGAIAAPPVIKPVEVITNLQPSQTGIQPSHTEIQPDFPLEAGAIAPPMVLPLKETLVLEPDEPPVPPPPTAALSTANIPALDIEATHLDGAIELLANLPPNQLLQELLGRVLLGGIGRLYLERQANHGRILWSQNGVLQSVLEELPLEQFQGVINELKVLTHLPLLPVQKPKQVEVERLYQKSRLMLRVRVMPGVHGEDATVQVLRGAALKFYQQQQLANLSREALAIAQELQRKVNEIRVHTRFYPMLTVEQLSILPALDKVIQSVEQQLEALKAMQLGEAEIDENGDD